MPFDLRNSAYLFLSHSFSCALGILLIPVPSYVLLVKELLNLLLQRLHSLFFSDLSFCHIREPELDLIFIKKYVILRNSRIIFVCLFQLFSNSCNCRNNIAATTPKKSFRLKPHVLLKDIIHKYCLLNGLQQFIYFFGCFYVWNQLL